MRHTETCSAEGWRLLTHSGIMGPALKSSRGREGSGPGVMQVLGSTALLPQTTVTAEETQGTMATVQICQTQRQEQKARLEPLQFPHLLLGHPAQGSCGQTRLLGPNGSPCSRCSCKRYPQGAVLRGFGSVNPEGKVFPLTFRHILLLKIVCMLLLGNFHHILSESQE